MEPYFTWEDLIANGTIDDLYVEVVESLKMGFPVPVDAMTKLNNAGYYIKETDGRQRT